MDDTQPISSTVTFEIDTGAGQLGSKQSKEIPEGKDYFGLESKDTWKGKVTSDITHIFHGTFSGQPACVILFKFAFLFNFTRGPARISESRFTATVKPSSNNATQVPEVRVISPRLLEGHATVAQRDVSTFTGVSVPGMQLPNKTKKTSFTKESRSEVRGFRFRAGEVYDTAQWTMTEDRKMARGIPTDFSPGMIVQHHGKPFELIVKVNLKMKHSVTSLELFAWPWSSETPVLVKPQTQVNDQTVSKDFSALGDEEWKLWCSADWAEETLGSYR